MTGLLLSLILVGSAVASSSSDDCDAQDTQSALQTKLSTADELWEFTLEPFATPKSGARSFTDMLALEEPQGASLLEDSAEAQDTDTAGGCALPKGARWCTARSKDKEWEMAVYAGPDPVSNTICSTGTWEFKDPGEMGVTSGNTLLDVGANVGWYSFMFAQHGYNVLAIEPMTANRELINATLCKNPELAKRINVVAVALTDKAKPGQTCTIFSANINLGDGLVACGDDQKAELTGPQANNAQFHHVAREKVPLKTLDEVLASSTVKNIDVMKMDVERYECLVLQGGSTLFSRFHPNGLMIEARFEPKGAKSAVGSTVDCTVQAVMKGGKYQLHKDSLHGGLIKVPKDNGQEGLYNLYFRLEGQ